MKIKQSLKILVSMVLLAGFTGPFSPNASAAISIVFGAQTDDGLDLSNGNPVPLNSQVFLGYYTVAVTSSSFSNALPASQFLNNFTTLASAVMGFDADSNPSTPLEAGLFAGGATIPTGTATHDNKQLYYLVGNNSNFASSTEVGLFTSASWLVPVNTSAPTPTILSTDIRQVVPASGIVFGSYLAGGGAYGDAYRLSAVIPEPATGSLLLLGGLGLVALRRLRKV